MATKLKTSLSFTSDCSMNRADTTGFYSATNLDGFYDEAAGSVPKDSYKISNVYFYDVLVYNRYNATKLIKNTANEDITAPEVPVVIASGSVNASYADNFTAKLYSLKLDGHYTFYRFAIPTQAFYDAEKTGVRFVDRSIYYSNGTNIYKVVSGVATVISISDFIKEDLTASVVSYSKNSFISICYLNKCFADKVKAIIDAAVDVKCTKDLTTVNKLKSERDLLFAITYNIRYLQNLCENDEAQRLIELIMACGGMCSSTLVSNDNDCGCHG